MAEQLATATARTVSARELYPELHRIPAFAQTSEQDLACLGDVEILEVPAGTVIYRGGEGQVYFWIVLRGELRAFKTDSDGGQMHISGVKEGDTFGEVTI